MESQTDKNRPHKGTLIIRKARPGELAYILGELPAIPPLREDGFINLWPGLPGPRFSWCFPPEWVETFFRGTGEVDIVGEPICFSTRTWYLSDILGQTEHLELRLQAEEL
jgi:hypothetical protein